MALNLFSRTLSHTLRLWMLAALLAGLVWTAQAPGVAQAALSAGNETQLVAAINTANGTPGADTITITANIYLSTTALPQITSEITIEGGSYFISGESTYRVFDVNNSGKLTLHQVSVVSGKANNGAGIQNQGTLTINSSILQNNNATLSGGGIMSNGGAVTVTNSTFSGNTATAGGGAIYNNGGTLSVTNSTFSVNITPDAGGGIYTNSGSVTVTSSTFSGNAASKYGGAIMGNGGTLTVTNSTLSNNTATLSGGGVYSNGSTVKIIESTLGRNSGGGIFRNSSSGSVSLASVLLAVGASGSNCSGVITDAGYNLSDDNTCAFSATGSKNNAHVSLAVLAQNGGTTQTHSPHADSEALDRIPLNTNLLSINLCPASAGVDQRGTARPSPAGGACDAGAYEATYYPAGDPTQLAAAINTANNLPGLDIITLSANVTLTADLPQITSEVMVNGGLHAISGNHARRVFKVAGNGNLTLYRVTVRDGLLSGIGNNGGGILNSGVLTVNNSTLTGNTATVGGAIDNLTGSVTIANSTLSGNTATGDPSSSYGGGIFNDGGTVVIDRSILSTNTAALCGGAIASDKGEVTITNTTLAGNTALCGAGMRIWEGTTTLNNSTLSGNTATSWAGGIAMDTTSTGALAVSNSTFSGNTGDAVIVLDGITLTVKTSTFSGNGFGVMSSGGIVKITSSTLFNNSQGDVDGEGGTFSLAGTLLGKKGSNANCSGSITDAGYNLSDDATCAFKTTGSKNNASLGLIALWNNGGPTQTHALLLTSEALNRIPLNTSLLGVNLCPATGGTDQRGQPRPNPPGGPCDAGAVEMGKPLRVYLPVIKR